MAEPHLRSEDLLARRVRYKDLVPCTTAFIDTRTPGSERKENFTIIGPGVAESPDQHVHISIPHGFNIGGARQPPRCVNSQHSHETAEVFVVHSGTWAFRTGEHADDGEVVIGPGDVISIPTKVFRGFENIGEDEGFLFAVLGGDDPGRVLWAPSVFEAARDYGLVLLESGQLVDTAAGQTVPPDQRPMPVTSRDDVAALDVLDSAALANIVYRRASFKPAENSLLSAEGIAETPIIGDKSIHVSDPIEGGAFRWPHGFQLRHVELAPGAQSARLQRHTEEVLFVQSGSIVVEVSGEAVELGPGDVFTVPVSARRQLRNPTAERAELYLVLGSDQPSAQVA